MNKWLALAVASAVASGSFAQQSQPGAKDFLAGQEAIKRNDFAAAIPAFERAVAANPDLFASNYYLGWAYRTKENWQKCGQNFETFLEKVGSDPKAAEMIQHATREGGLCYARAYEITKAVPLLQRAAVANPDDQEVGTILDAALGRSNPESEAEKAASFTGPGASAEGCDVGIAAFELRRTKNDVGRDVVALLLSIDNRTDDRVTAWRMELVIKDVFGEELVTTKATDGSANILPGAKKTSIFSWDDNPYVEGEAYDRLATYNAENVRIEITSCQVASK